MIRYRLANAGDARAICDIYTPYVRDTTATFDEAVPDRTALQVWLSDPLHPVLLAHEDDEVVGFAGTHVHNPRSAYRWALNLGVYCRQGATRRGIGSGLYGRLLPVLSRMGYRRAIAGVTQPNKASMALHRRHCFREAARYERIGYKLGRWLDVIWMQRDLEAAAADSGAPPQEILPVEQVLCDHGLDS